MPKAYDRPRASVFARGKYSMVGFPDVGENTHMHKRTHNNLTCSTVDGIPMELCHFRIVAEYEV